VKPACRADNSALLVAPNVKKRKEAQHSIPPLSLKELLQGSFYLHVVYLAIGLPMAAYAVSCELCIAHLYTGYNDFNLRRAGSPIIRDKINVINFVLCNLVKLQLYFHQIFSIAFFLIQI
jgi:hypothetical protein